MNSESLSRRDGNTGKSQAGKRLADWAGRVGVEGGDGIDILKIYKIQRLQFGNDDFSIVILKKK